MFIFLPNYIATINFVASQSSTAVILLDNKEALAFSPVTIDHSPHSCSFVFSKPTNMNADMYSFLLHLHSILRWVVLLLLLVAIFNSLVAGDRPFIRTDARTGSILTGFADLMLLIGLVLWYFNARGFQAFKNSGFSEVMRGDSMTRFFAFEHPVGMLIAIILLHIGKVQGRKAISDKAKHRRTLLFYFIALLIILLSIPWPFRQQVGGHWY